MNNVLALASYCPRALRVVAFLAGVSAVVFLLGCNSIPKGRSTVDEVKVRGADKLDEGDIEDKITTTEAPKLLGLFRGVIYEYTIFDRAALQRDMARVEAYYRSRGYFEAHARAGRIHVKDYQHVSVEIVVEEGEAVTNDEARFEGLEELPANIVDAVKKAARLTLEPKKPFEQEQFEKAEGAVRRALSDRGYAYATSKGDAGIDIVNHKAHVTFVVAPGPVCKFGPITIEGLGQLPEPPVRRAIDIEQGEPYSEATLDAAQQAVLDLGVFASVKLEPDLPNPPRPDRIVPVKVTVEPSRLRTIRLGGGLEFDILKTDVHGLVGWENRNFLGGFRTFSVNFRPGVVLYPVRLNNITVPKNFLPEERLRLELRQPGFPEARTNAFIRPDFDIYPVLIDPDPPPNAPVLGYAEQRTSVGVDRVFGKLFVALSHNVQVAYPFKYLGTPDDTLSLLVISYPELLTNLDFRDDRVHPRKGIYIGNTLQYAGGPFGGDARDLKVQPDVRGYIPLGKRVVWANRASVGLMYPQGYGDRIKNPIANEAPSADRTRDYQLTFFRGFFSGGPSSNRGYPLRGIGPYDNIPFLSPDIQLQQNDNLGESKDLCSSTFPIPEPPQGQEKQIDCRTPTGGFTLWEASTEIRINVNGPLSVATFCDASDVSPQTTDIRLDRLHLSCGVGGRYDTPAGPVRIDIGYRIPGMQGSDLRERPPPDLFAGIPIAVHFGIGEAY